MHVGLALERVLIRLRERLRLFDGGNRQERSGQDDVGFRLRIEIERARRAILTGENQQRRIQKSLLTKDLVPGVEIRCGAGENDGVWLVRPRSVQEISPLGLVTETQREDLRIGRLAFFGQRLLKRLDDGDRIAAALVRDDDEAGELRVLSDKLGQHFPLHGRRHAQVEDLLARAGRAMPVERQDRDLGMVERRRFLQRQSAEQGDRAVDADEANRLGFVSVETAGVGVVNLDRPAAQRFRELVVFLQLMQCEANAELRTFAGFVEPRLVGYMSDDDRRRRRRGVAAQCTGEEDGGDGVSQESVHWRIPLGEPSSVKSRVCSSFV